VKGGSNVGMKKRISVGRLLVGMLRRVGWAGRGCGGWPVEGGAGGALGTNGVRRLGESVE